MIWILAGWIFGLAFIGIVGNTLTKMTKNIITVTDFKFINELWLNATYKLFLGVGYFGGLSAISWGSDFISYLTYGLVGAIIYFIVFHLTLNRKYNMTVYAVETLNIENDEQLEKFINDKEIK